MPYSPPSTSVNLTGPITSLGSVTSITSQTGTGTKFVVDTSPTLITPDLGTPTALVGTNISGTAAGLTAGNVTTNANLTGGVTSVGNAATVVTNANLTGGVTSVGNAATVVTNANLTGVITSVGNATSIASQTGTGTKFVVDTSPTLVTPNIGVATGTSLSLSGSATGISVTSTSDLTSNFNGTVGVYSRYQVGGTSVGDVGSGNSLISGGSASDFGINVRGANKTIIGVNSAKVAEFTSTGLNSTAIGATTPSTVAGTTGRFTSDLQSAVNSSGGQLIAYRNAQATYGFSGGVNLDGMNTSSAQYTLGKVLGYTIDNTAGAEKGEVHIQARNAGALATVATFTSTGLNSTAIGATTPSTVAGTGFYNSALVSGEVFNATKSNAGYYVGVYKNSSVTGFGLFVQNGLDTNPAIRISNASGSDNAIQLYGNGNGSFGGTLSATGLGAFGTLSSNFAKLNVKQTAADAYGIVIENSAGDKWLRLGHNGTNGIVETTYNATGPTTDLIVRRGGGADVTFGATGLAVTGEITATGNITAYYSDDRLKNKLGNIENALDKVCSLDGFYYEANETAQKLGYKAVREVGVSAQSVEKVLPELIQPAPIDPQYKTLDYARLVPLLIEAIKEQQGQINELKSRLGK